MDYSGRRVFIIRKGRKVSMIALLNINDEYLKDKFEEIYYTYSRYLYKIVESKILKMAEDFNKLHVKKERRSINYGFINL